MTDEPAGDDGVFARESRYLETYVQIVVEDGHITEVTFPERPDESAGEKHPMLDRIEKYLTGTVKDNFDDVPVAPDVSDDIAEVLEAVRTIPYGTALSCAELLRENKGLDPTLASDHDLVRVALDANPTPLVIPDHRIRDAPSGAPPAIEQRLRSLERIVT